MRFESTTQLNWAYENCIDWWFASEIRWIARQLQVLRKVNMFFVHQSNNITIYSFNFIRWNSIRFQNDNRFSNEIMMTIIRLTSFYVILISIWIYWWLTENRFMSWDPWVAHFFFIHFISLSLSWSTDRRIELPK